MAAIARRGLAVLGRLPRLALVLLVRAYQLLLSPVFPAACRYDPSCSEYAAQALGRHGALRGGWLAVRRIGRCHPWGGAGYDPVPTVQRASAGARPLGPDNVADAR